MKNINKISTSSHLCRSPLRLGFGVAGVGACLIAVMLGKPATAADLTLNLEPAVAVWADKPQGDRFGTGFYMAVRPGLSLGRVVSLQLSYAMLLVPAGEGFDNNGMSHALMGGLRVRPLAPLQAEEDQLGGLFVDANAGYIRTGELDRFGFDAGIGYNFQLAPWLALGPVVRYSQVLQPDDLANKNPNDAQYFTAGINFAFGAPVEEEPAVVPPVVCPDVPECVQDTCPPVPECVQIKQPASLLPTCIDSDRDGVCDDSDRCPTQVGSAATMGCPVDPCKGEPLMVLVQFGQDSAGMPAVRAGNEQTMDPVLDEIARAIQQDPSCRVCIMGFASEEGADDYNMDLSRRRAQAVQNYMTGQGLKGSRLPTTGWGETCQLVPEATRTLNRRVEFHRLEEGESCPTKCEE